MKYNLNCSMQTNACHTSEWSHDWGHGGTDNSNVGDDRAATTALERGCQLLADSEQIKPQQLKLENKKTPTAKTTQNNKLEWEQKTKLSKSQHQYRCES